MRPDDFTTLRRSRWFQQMGSAEFLVLLGSQSGNDEISLLAEEKVAIFVLDQKGGPPAGRFTTGRLERRPDAVAGF